MRFIPVHTTSHSISHVPALWQRHQNISFAGRYEDGLDPLLAQLEQRPYIPPAPPPSIERKVVAQLQRVPIGVAGWGFWGLVMLIVFINGFGSLFDSTSEPTEVAVATPTDEPTATPTETVTPEITVIPTVAPSGTPQPPAPTPTLIPTAEAQLYDTMQRENDGMTMMYVPGGTFMMGQQRSGDR